MTHLRSGQLRQVDVFWAEMAACEHCVQIYENDTVFLDGLQSFIEAGLRLDEACIVIATASHLQLLAQRLEGAGVDLAGASAREQFIAIDADVAMASFMREDWPDEALFLAFVSALLARVRPKFPQVRAFGEMVALMWANGDREATICLENLWSRLCKSERFALFCAYPRAGFTQDAEESIRDVHLAHSLVFNAA